jgi:hypothetical protein
MGSSSSVPISGGWAIAGISLTSILGALFLGAAIYFSYTSGYSSGVWVGVGAFLYAVINFIPFGLITFGFIADMIGQDFRYSIGSIIGLISILLNWLIGTLTGYSSFSSQGIEQPGRTFCMIPGLEGFENRSMPMNLVASTSILSYYIIYASIKRPVATNISLYISSAVLILAQYALFYMSDCSKYYEGSAGIRLAGVALSIVIGALGWVTISQTSDWLAPFVAGDSRSGIVENMLSGPGWDGSKTSQVFQKLAPRTGAQCSKDESEDGDEFVCEAYKNGKLVTENISS